MGDEVKVRIPFLENLATQYGGAFAISERELTTAELSIVRPIFGQSVNYGQVKIVATQIAAAPTTLGNNIRIPPGYHLVNGTLVHEMTHIWQFQTKGNSYISDSFLHQAAGIINSGDRNAAYTYEIAAGKSFHHYTAEQQAMIVQHYFNDPLLQNDPEYSKLIDELRSARPVLTNTDRYLESLYGRGYRNDRFFDPLPSAQRSNTEVVPVVRVEF